MSFAKLEDWFHEAVDASPTAREEILEHAMTVDAELGNELRRLVAREVGRTTSGAAQTLSSERPSRSADAVSSDDSDHAFAPGALVGRYRVVERIGRGGMGDVYLAERSDGQYVQRVALKTLRLGRSSKELRARLRAERQILALLQHPDIARLLDGAVDPRGLPYLVMELVEGVPITVACDRGFWGIERRLRLFARVCRAVHHAHTNLIVHRDLKPSNILVDQEGNPKLLDFGIAKLLDVTRDDLNESMPVTSMFGPMLTPEYASPEQVRGLPVTTACDIYTLGLLLHELLCGQRAQNVPSSSWSELEHTVCEMPLTTASTAAGSTEAEAQRQHARSRGFDDPRQWVRRLRGDLDLIIATAAHKDPQRRYSSALQLAEDLESHLAQLPIKAHPDRVGYRLAKFVRRRPGAVASAALGTVLLSAAAVISTVGFLSSRAAEQVARNEAEIANEVTGFLVGLFRANDPANARGQAVSARQILDDGAARLASELTTSPTVRLRLLRSVADSYEGLGEIAAARHTNESILALCRSEFGEDSIETGRALISLGNVSSMDGQFEQAREQIQSGLDRLEELGTGSTELGMAQAQLGRSLAQLREYDAAREVLEHALQLLEEEEAGRRQRWGPMNTLGGVLLTSRDYAGAREVLAEALQLAQTELHPDHPRLMVIKTNLAQTLSGLGEQEEALAIHLDLLERRIRILPADHPVLAATYHNVGSELLGLERPDEALPYAQKALDLRREVLADRHPLLASSLHNVAEILRFRSQLLEARDLYLEELGILEQLPEGWALRQVDPIVGIVAINRELGEERLARELATRAVDILALHDTSSDAWLVEQEEQLRRYLEVR